MAGLPGVSSGTPSGLVSLDPPSPSSSVLQKSWPVVANDFPKLRRSDVSFPVAPDASFLSSVKSDGLRSEYAQGGSAPSSSEFAQGGSAPSSWADITKKVTGSSSNLPLPTSRALSAQRRRVNPFLPLKFFPSPPSDGVDPLCSPPEEVTLQCQEFWGFTLIGYFSEKPLHYLAVRSIASRIWARFGINHVATNGKGFFFFSFDSEAQLSACLAHGPWTFRRKSLFLKRWSPGMVLTKDTQKMVPVWISLLNVPFEFWTPMGLSWIASRVGRPLCLDPRTANLDIMHAARICVEVDRDISLPDRIRVPMGSGMSLSSVEVEEMYHWPNGGLKDALPPPPLLAGAHGAGHLPPLKPLIVSQPPPPLDLLPIDFTASFSSHLPRPATPWPHLPLSLAVSPLPLSPASEPDFLPPFRIQSFSLALLPFVHSGHCASFGIRFAPVVWCRDRSSSSPQLKPPRS